MAPEPLYQVILLGAGSAVHGPGLTRTLMRRFADLGIDAAASLRLLSPADLLAIVPNAPLVAVYLGGDIATDQSEVSSLALLAVPIVPVVDDLEGYTGKTPAVLHPINAMAVDWRAPDFGEVVNVILENLSLLRRTRRLFLSYLRAESTPAAHQLRVAFDDAGYDPFLDTSSVPKSDDFQSVLWHRLLDSDVLVVLDTPAFLTSRWTREELAQASAMSVGIVRVMWPGVDRGATAALATHLYLDGVDFDGDRLTEAALNRVVTTTEAVRARCIAARHSNLVVEYCEEARRTGATIAVQPGGYVLTCLADGRRVAAIPAVGVPDANLYHHAHGLFDPAAGDVDEAVLIYDHRGMLPSWNRFLNWLDDYLPVKGIRVTETAARLGAAR